MKYKFVLVIILVLAIVARVPFFGHKGHELDFGYFEAWAEHTSRLGVVEAYKSDTSGIDYPPVYLYVLNVLGNVYRAAGYTEFNSLVIDDWFRVVNVGVDLAVGIFIFLAARKLRDEKWGVIAAGLFLLNPYVIYSSLVWGQVDNLIGLGLIGAVVALAYNKQVPATMSLVIGLFTKFQTLIFLPLSGIYALRNWSWKQLLKGLIAGLLTAAAIASPFILSGNINQLVRVYTEANGRYPYVTLNAQNLWWFIADPRDFSVVGDDIPLIFGFTAKTLGLMSFGIVYLIVILGLWRSSKNKISNLIQKRLPRKPQIIHPLLNNVGYTKEEVVVERDPVENPLNISTLLLGYFTIVLAFFTLSTQMHERYLYPAFVLLPFLVWQGKGYWLIYVALTITQLLGLMYVLPYTEELRPLVYTGFPQVTYAFAAIHLLILGGLIAGWLKKLKG